MRLTGTLSAWNMNKEFEIWLSFKSNQEEIIPLIRAVCVCACIVTVLKTRTLELWEEKLPCHFGGQQ